MLALLYLWRYNAHLLNPLLLRAQEQPEFHYLAAHCGSLEPIQPSEYHTRQSALASVLHSLRAAAYIAEPGPNAEYFANLSLSQWDLSDRPFLLMISPLESITSPAQIVPQITIITPLFESSLAQLLAIPTAGNVRFIPWADDADPYAVAISSLRDSVDMAKDEVSIFIDENSRYFVAEGIKIAADGIRTEITPPEIRALREQKSPAEIALLRCANEVSIKTLTKTQNFTKFRRLPY
jgi:Xaa-Pro aminopeptidase